MLGAVTAATPTFCVGPPPRPVRDQLFGDSPWWVVTLLAVVALPAAYCAALAGVGVLMSGAFGGPPEPASTVVAFVVGLVLCAAVAVGYWKTGRALVPTVLMAAGSVVLVLPMLGYFVGLPLVTGAVVTSFVGPVVRMRHKRVVAVWVAVVTAAAVLAGWLVVTSYQAGRARQDVATAVEVVLARQAAGEVTTSGVHDGDELTTTGRTRVLEWGHVPLTLVATEHTVCAVSRNAVRGRYYGHDERGPRSGRTRDEVCPLATAAEGFSIEYPVEPHVVYDGSAVPVISGGREPFSFRLVSELPGVPVQAAGGVAVRRGHRGVPRGPVMAGPRELRAGRGGGHRRGRPDRECRHHPVLTGPSTASGQSGRSST